MMVAFWIERIDLMSMTQKQAELLLTLVAGVRAIFADDTSFRERIDEAAMAVCEELDELGMAPPVDPTQN
jgi:hypothetical protein